MKAAKIVEVIVRVKGSVIMGEVTKPNHFYGVFTDYPTQGQIVNAIYGRAEFDEMPLDLLGDLLSYVERLPSGEQLKGGYTDENGSVYVKQTLLFQI